MDQSLSSELWLGLLFHVRLVLSYRFLHYLLCLCHAFLKNCDELVQVSLCVLREQTDSEAGLTDLDHGVLDTVHVNSIVHHNASSES